MYDAMDDLSVLGIIPGIAGLLIATFWPSQLRFWVGLLGAALTVAAMDKWFIEWRSMSSLMGPIVVLSVSVAVLLLILLFARSLGGAARRATTWAFIVLSAGALACVALGLLRWSDVDKWTLALFVPLATFAFRKSLLGTPASSGSVKPDESSSARRKRPIRTSNAPSDVFISYKREERVRVEAIAQALRDLKLNVWFDARLQSGKSFDDEINREVRSAKCVLVCWSQAAVASEWVRAEASIGRQRGVLAACFLERCDLYPPFNLVHAEDLSAGALDGSNPAWCKIVAQIGHLSGRSGLGAYLLAQQHGDRASFGAWLADNAHDPLADVVMARLRQA